MSRWQKAQKWEKEWWGSCVNTFGEEMKQLLYAQKMGLHLQSNDKVSHFIDMEGKSVVDLGSGPVSLLLKCDNVEGYIVDPLISGFPQWVRDRYSTAGLYWIDKAGEDLKVFMRNGKKTQADEVWIYNTLQHTKDPEAIVRNARSIGKIVRIFEWINMPANVGHPQVLIQENLDLWLGGTGKIEKLRGQNNCWGTAYYGIFKGSE